MSNHTLEHWVEINGYQYEARTLYWYTPGYAGAIEGGVQVEPDCEPELELGGTEISIPGAMTGLICH